VWLQRLHIPRALGAAIVMAGVVRALVVGSYALRGQMQRILEQLPEAIGKVSTGLASLRESQASTMQKVQSAASEIEKATSQAMDMPAKTKLRTTKVAIDQPGFQLGNFLWSGSMSAAGCSARQPWCCS
jgi:predicted PurR-regulated permease PerM